MNVSNEAYLSLDMSQTLILCDRATKESIGRSYSQVSFDGEYFQWVDETRHVPEHKHTVVHTFDRSFPTRQDHRGI